jgi:hypothetical protein
VKKNIPEKLVLREMVADCTIQCRGSKRNGDKCLKDTDDCTFSNPLPVAGNLK